MTLSRWQYRYDNYCKACSLLEEAVALHQTRSLSPLEQEGLGQRFAFTWELAWKLLKDYLEYKGVVLDMITPATVIRAAAQAKLINNVEAWMNVLAARNQLAHTYDAKAFQALMPALIGQYVPMLLSLRDDFQTA